MSRLSKRYIPEDSTGIINEEAKTAVYCYGKDGLPLAIGYSNKKRKPDFHIRFKSVERRAEYIKEFEEMKLKYIKEDIEYKRVQKEKRAEAIKTLSIGDIFHCGWGYDQTQCDFYKMIDFKGVTGTFIAIGNIQTSRESGYDSCYEIADPSKTFGEPFKKRLNGAGFKISSFQHASKVENPETNEFYHSWYA